jgi:hypothetical protein
VALLRTKRLGVHVVAVANTVETVYVVPTGFRGVLRDIRLSSPGAGASTLTLLFLTASGGTPTYWIYSGPLANNASASVLGDMVLEPGDSLGVFSDKVGVTVWASGAQLELPT